jgi:hypothetical protein
LILMRYLRVVLLIAGILIAGPIVRDGLQILNDIGGASSRVTVIYKNQTLPSIGDLEARGAKASDNTDEVNSDDAIVLYWRHLWI